MDAFDIIPDVCYTYGDAAGMARVALLSWRIHLAYRICCLPFILSVAAYRLDTSRGTVALQNFPRCGPCLTLWFCSHSLRPDDDCYRRFRLRDHRGICDRPNRKSLRDIFAYVSVIIRLVINPAITGKMELLFQQQAQRKPNTYTIIVLARVVLMRMTVRKLSLIRYRSSPQRKATP